MNRDGHWAKGNCWLSEESGALSWIMWECPMGVLPSSSFPEIGLALGGWFSVCNAYRRVRENEPPGNAGRVQTYINLEDGCGNMIS